MQATLIPSDLRRGVSRGIVVVIVVVGSPGPTVKSRPSFSFFLPLLTRASLDLPRVKSYGRTDGQVTQTDAAHLSRFEWSEWDRWVGIVAREDARGTQKKKEREREKKTMSERKSERETGLGAIVGRAARPRRTGGEFSDAKGTPRRAGASRWRRSICCSFFSYPLLSLSRPSSRSSSTSLFLSLRQTPAARILSFFVRLSSIVSLFPVWSLASLFLFLTEREFLFFALRSHRFSFRAVNFFSSERNARRVITPRATSTRFSPWELTRSTFWRNWVIPPM